MPVRSGTVKIFLGNLSETASADDVRPLFEAFGNVVETDIIKNYGFVHMEDEAEAKRAIAALNGKEVKGKPMVVELSTGVNRRGGSRRGRTKIFVGNMHKNTQVEELRGLFSPHGSVVEADIISNYAFVHMDNEEEAQVAIDALQGCQLHGQEIRVQMSTSSVRPAPGMDKADICFRCGSPGHWSRDCGRQEVSAGYGGGGGVHPAVAAHQLADWGGGGYQAAAGVRERARYAPYPAYAPAPPAYRREPYYEAHYPPAPAYFDPYDDYGGGGGLYDRRRVTAAPLPAIHDPYGPPPQRRYQTEETAAAAAAALYDRRAPAYRY